MLSIFLSRFLAASIAFLVGCVLQARVVHAAGHALYMDP